MWLQLEYVGNSRYRVWIHWWHPAFWRWAYRQLRDANSGVLEATILTLVLIYQVAKRKK